MNPQDLPKRVTDLKTIPEPYRIAYCRDHEERDYVLDLRIFNVVQKGEAEIARLNQKIAEVAKQREAFEKGRVSYWARQQLEDEVKAAGVRPKLARGAAALIAEGVEFEVENSGDGEIAIARTSVGLKSLGALVNDFLLSDDGRDFRPPRSAPESSYFAAMVADLKRPR